MTWSSRKKREGIFVLFILPEGTFFQHLCFISMCSVLNRLLECTYFYISKSITSYTFLLVFKIVESLQCILNPGSSKKLHRLNAQVFFNRGNVLIDNEKYIEQKKLC